MGSYPSADLVYGIDLGILGEVDYDWYTDEMEAEHGSSAEALDHLLQGVEGVGYTTYGNAYSEYGGLALSTQCLGARAYEATHISAGVFADVTGEDDEKLRVAWSMLHPDTAMPEPGWFIVVSYG